MITVTFTKAHSVFVASFLTVFAARVTFDCYYPVR